MGNQEDLGSTAAVQVPPVETELCSTPVPSTLGLERPPRVFRAKHELASRLAEHGSGIPLNEFYLANVSPVNDPQTKVLIRIADDLAMRTERAAVSQTAVWNLTNWNDPFGSNLVMFVPQPQGNLGQNVNHFGRETGGGWPGDSCLTIQPKNGDFWAVSPFVEDRSFYPPMKLQVPSFEAAQVVMSGGVDTAPVNHVSPLPYAEFGVVVHLKDARGEEITMDRKVIAYADKVLLAEREIVHGIPTDCSAAHWEERLIPLDGIPTQERLEAGVNGYEAVAVRYFTSPAELAPLMGLTKSDDKLEDPTQFYSRLAEIIRRNTRTSP